MSRSGYSDECDNWERIKWRGAVASALRGKRGQAFLREALAALDSLPEKRLIAEELVTPEGECCLMGAVAQRRGTDVRDIDPDEREEVSQAMQIATALACEIAEENDKYRDDYVWTLDGHKLRPGETPEERFTRMRNWVLRNIIVTPDELLPLEVGEKAGRS